MRNFECIVMMIVMITMLVVTLKGEYIEYRSRNIPEMSLNQKPGNDDEQLVTKLQHLRHRKVQVYDNINTTRNPLKTSKKLQNKLLEQNSDNAEDHDLRKHQQMQHRRRGIKSTVKTKGNIDQTWTVKQNKYGNFEDRDEMKRLLSSANNATSTSSNKHLRRRTRPKKSKRRPFTNGIIRPPNHSNDKTLTNGEIRTKYDNSEETDEMKGRLSSANTATPTSSKKSRRRRTRPKKSKRKPLTNVIISTRFGSFEDEDEDEMRPVWGIVPNSTPSTKPSTRRTEPENLEPRDVLIHSEGTDESRPVWGFAIPDTTRQPQLYSTTRRMRADTNTVNTQFKDDEESRPVWGLGAVDRSTVMPTRLPKRKSTTVPPLVH